MKATINELLAADFSVKIKINPNEEGKLVVDMTAQKKGEIMKKINLVDWPYFIQTKDKKWNKPINNIDCMRIHFKIEEIQNNPDADKKLFCGL